MRNNTEAESAASHQPLLSPRPIPTSQLTLTSDIFPSVPSSQASIRSDIFPNVPETSRRRESDNISHAPSAIALEAAFSHIAFDPDQFRASPEPVGSRILTVDDLISNPTDPAAIAILTPLFARPEVRGAMDERNRRSGSGSRESLLDSPPRRQSTIRPAESSEQVNRASAFWDPHTAPLVPTPAPVSPPQAEAIPATYQPQTPVRDDDHGEAPLICMYLNRCPNQ
jgi:hypothetical protein